MELTVEIMTFREPYLNEAPSLTSTILHNSLVFFLWLYHSLINWGVFVLQAMRSGDVPWTAYHLIILWSYRLLGSLRVDEVMLSLSSSNNFEVLSWILYMNTHIACWSLLYFLAN